MTHLDKVIRNLEKELEQLKRINTMLKSDDLRQILYRTETRVGKDLDALDFDCYDNQTRGAEIQTNAIPAVIRTTPSIRFDAKRAAVVSIQSVVTFILR